MLKSLTVSRGFSADQPGVEVYHLSINYKHHQKNLTNRRRHPNIKYFDSKISTSTDIYGPPLINNCLQVVQPDVLLIYNNCNVAYRNLCEIDKIPKIRKNVRVILYLDVMQEKMSTSMLEFIRARADNIYVFTDIWAPYIKNSRVLYHWIAPFF